MKDDEALDDDKAWEDDMAWAVDQMNGDQMNVDDLDDRELIHMQRLVREDNKPGQDRDWAKE